MPKPDASIYHPRKLKPTRRCGNCKWHEPYTGACCNGESPNRADFTDEDDYCKFWQEGEQYANKSF